MKKLYYIIGVFAFMAVFGLTSCGDNENVSNPHVLTEEELAEMAKQDSIRQAQLNSINADLVLEYTVEDYASSTWTNQPLYIDLDKIAELFGLTTEQLKNAINQEDGAVELTGFAIQGTTHSDYSGLSTTSGTWGHWWNLSSDACTWSDGNLSFFCEWQGDYFAVGQCPGNVKEGETYTAIEGLKYGDKRAAVKVTYKLIPRAAIVASVVDTQTFNAEFAASAESYDGANVTIDIDAILSKLGVSSVSDISVVGFKEDGSLTQEYTSNSAFWYTKEGYPTTYGETAVAYIEYFGNQAEAEADDLKTLYVGQMPGSLTAGDTFSLPVGLMANNKVVKLVVNVTVK